MHALVSKQLCACAVSITAHSAWPHLFCVWWMTRWIRETYMYMWVHSCQPSRMAGTVPKLVPMSQIAWFNSSVPEYSLIAQNIDVKGVYTLCINKGFWLLNNLYTLPVVACVAWVKAVQPTEIELWRRRWEVLSMLFSAVSVLPFPIFWNNHEIT
jgi:hypothetical protein